MQEAFENLLKAITCVHVEKIFVLIEYIFHKAVLT